jgi:hypothetical protein
LDWLIAFGTRGAKKRRELRNVFIQFENGASVTKASRKLGGSDVGWCLAPERAKVAFAILVDNPHPLHAQTRLALYGPLPAYRRFTLGTDDCEFRMRLQPIRRIKSNGKKGPSPMRTMDEDHMRVSFTISCFLVSVCGLPYRFQTKPETEEN